MRDLEGRVALVTGSSAGIGAGIAEELASRGAAVAVNYNNSVAEANAVVEKIKAAGGVAVAVRADVSDQEAVRAMFMAAELELGDIDILVCSAGVRSDGLFPTMKNEKWNVPIAVKVDGTRYCMMEVLRKMRKKGWGRIVVVSSIVGIEGNYGQSNYAAANAAVIGLAKTVGREYAEFGVTVNVVAPGFIDTDMTSDLPDDVKQAALARTLVHRFGTVDEVAYEVANLASPRAGFTTCEVRVVSGGLRF